MPALGNSGPSSIQDRLRRNAGPALRDGEAGTKRRHDGNLVRVTDSGLARSNKPSY